MAVTTGASETWQARISHDLAVQLRSDAELLGLDGRTEIVKAALDLLHRRAAEERMARSVDDFYADHDVPPCRSVSDPRGRTTGPMSLPEPCRGEVWHVDFDEFGLHPAVVPSVNALNARPGHVAVVPVTGTAGPEQTHIPLTAYAGLTKCEQSYADITALQPVSRSRFLMRRGLLTVGELERLGRQLTVYLAL